MGAMISFSTAVVSRNSSIRRNRNRINSGVLTKNNENSNTDNIFTIFSNTMIISFFSVFIALFMSIAIYASSELNNMERNEKPSIKQPIITPIPKPTTDGLSEYLKNPYL